MPAHSTLFFPTMPSMGSVTNDDDEARSYYFQEVLKQSSCDLCCFPVKRIVHLEEMLYKQCYYPNKQIPI